MDDSDRRQRQKISVVQIECKLFKGHRGEHMTLFCSDSGA